MVHVCIGDGYDRSAFVTLLDIIAGDNYALITIFNGYVRSTCTHKNSKESSTSAKHPAIRFTVLSSRIEYLCPRFSNFP